MNGVIGKILFFDNAVNSCDLFDIQMQQLLLETSILDEMKIKATLVTLLAKASYTLLQNLHWPSGVEDARTTFGMCVLVIIKHFKLPPSSFTERCSPFFSPFFRV